MTRLSASILLLVSVTTPLAAQSSLEARVDEVFRQYASSETPGCTVGVAQNGRVLLERAYGMADPPPHRPACPTSSAPPPSRPPRFWRRARCRSSSPPPAFCCPRATASPPSTIRSGAGF